MKLKLEIQRFNSTNQTTHYDLSQYTANYKPTYLIDYNGDMAKIDTAIYGADARSLVNESAIGDLTELDTTAKNNLVSAVNEIFNYLALTDNRALSNPVVTDGSGNVMAGASVSANTIRVALNSAGTYGKIYGKITLTGVTGYPRVKFINTGINGVTESFDINAGGIVLGNNAKSITIKIDPPASGETSASITLIFGIWDGSVEGMLFPCLYYFTDFGDVE